MRNHNKFLLCLITSCFLLSACNNMGDRGSPGISAKEAAKLSKAEDRKIKSDIQKNLAAESDLFSEVHVDVSRNRVLLSGEVDEPEARVKAIEIAWQPLNVKEVISEIEIVDMVRLKSFADDVVIIAQGRAKLLREKKVSPAHYTIDAINGVVYLLGVADSKQELARIDYILSRIKGVKKVVNRITFKSADNVH